MRKRRRSTGGRGQAQVERGHVSVEVYKVQNHTSSSRNFSRRSVTSSRLFGTTARLSLRRRTNADFDLFSKPIASLLCSETKLLSNNNSFRLRPSSLSDGRRRLLCHLGLLKRRHGSFLGLNGRRSFDRPRRLLFGFLEDPRRDDDDEEEEGEPAVAHEAGE